MKTEPQKVLDNSLQILSEIRTTLQEQSTTTKRGALFLLELEALHLLGFAYHTVGNYRRAREIAQELLTISTELNNIEYSTNAELLLAKLFLSQGQYDSAKSLYNKLLPIFIEESNHYHIQAVYIDLSIVELNHSNYDLCLEYLHKAEKEYQLHPTKERVEVVILAQMINVYLRIGNLDKAMEYAQNYADITQKKNLVRDYPNALLQLSNLYAKKGDIQKQMDYIIEAIEHTEKHGIVDTTAKLRVALAQAYFDAQDFNASLSQYQLAESLLLSLSDTYLLAIVYLRLMNLFGSKQYKHNNLITARAYFKQAHEYAVQKVMPHFQSAILKEWSGVLFDFGKYKEAFETQAESYELEKNVLNEKSLDKLKQLEVQYDVILKEKENQLLTAEKKAIEQERDHLQNQLTMKTNSMLEQLKAVNQLRVEVLDTLKDIDSAEAILSKVKKKLNNSSVLRQDWKAFAEVFDQVHPTFVQNLLKQYPDLTKMEVRICMMLRAGLSTEEIAQLLYVTERNIENHRLRMRKKMKLKRNENIYSVISVL
jgi:tetratricopeptide (TPR) repeat protein